MDPALAKRMGLIPGYRVVGNISGMTGEIYKVFTWGVQVFNLDRQYEREDWSWSMFTIRTPRTMSRYPRSIRFPRRVPTMQCHCRRGKLEVRGVGKVECLHCGFLVGSESFPYRFARAINLLRKAYRPSGKKKRPNIKAQIHPEISGRTKNHRTGALKSKRTSHRRVVLPTRRISATKKGGRNG